jgi:signal transduction histidine kinase
MRTPLSAILGFAQLLEASSPFPTASQKRAIDLILEAGWCLDKLIGMTRDLAMLESGAAALSLQAVPLAAVMMNCQDSTEWRAHPQGVRVTYPSFEVPCFVLADSVRLQEVMIHLLAAARDDSTVDGVIAVTCENETPGWIRIRFNDGGKRALAAHGAGIGLLRAQRLVEMMGGILETRCTDGCETAFSVDLKRVPGLRRSRSLRGRLHDL